MRPTVLPRRSGFTLIELLTVLVLIAVLATIALHFPVEGP
jgi:prepilin-type N-terminal cleavage/methylation domain-containing protein